VLLYLVYIVMFSKRKSKPWTSWANNFG